MKTSYPAQGVAIGFFACSQDLKGHSSRLMCSISRLSVGVAGGQRVVALRRAVASTGEVAPPSVST